jgi:predicted DNA binding CopG/RHH family protein
MNKKTNKISKKVIKSIPQFKDEDEEREFWATHDTTDYFDTSNPIKMDLSNLRPSTETISLRLPLHLLDSIKRMANFKDVPYQSLIKIFLAERVEQELKK